MNLDEQFLEMTDKIRLIKLENENVIPKLILKVLETPEKSTSLTFFFVKKFNEGLNEGLNEVSTKSHLKNSNF